MHSQVQPPPVVSTDTLVIGAGQAGLSAAYYLQQRGVAFQVLEAAPAAGAAWAGRFQSLRLFSPAWASGLPGRAWPGSPLRFPTRDETTAYLRDYAAHFAFPIAYNQFVTRLTAQPQAGHYLTETANGPSYVSRRVIIATGPYTAPRIPTWALDLPAPVTQVPGCGYQHPAQLPGNGPVAVVGSGNSALQIAAELAATGRRVFVAFNEATPALPNNQLMWALLAATGLLRVPRHTALGRRMHARPEAVVRGDLVRLRRFPNVTFIGYGEAGLSTGAIRGRSSLSDPVEAVVWATGYRPDYHWLDLPVLDPDGAPRHYRGLTDAPGVAFLGLNWLDTRRSALLNGAGPDAQRVVSMLLRTS